MTPRERVLLAVDHQEPDRVPLALWGSWYGLTDKLYFNLLDTLGWEPVPPFRPDRFHSVNYYDDRILERLHVDVRHVDPGAIAAYSKTRSDGTDAFGIKWDTSGLYRTANHHPLEHASLAEINEYPFPDPDDIVQAEAIRARLKTIKAMDQEYAIVGRAVASYGFFEMSQSLRKHEQFFVDLAWSPEIVNGLVARLYDFYAALTERFLDAAGESLDIIELPGDDFAGNAGPLISPKMFDQFFKEPYQRLISMIKSHSPHIKVIYHSDGAMTAFLARLVEIGADIFHSAEPLPVWDLGEMKTKYGDQLVFMGGIDIREALQGDEAGVVAEVKTRLRELGQGGGYVLAPANHVQWDVPPQNLFTLFQAACEYGQYPLHLA
jgi:uroporphyrinogen decarboxylase